MLVSLESSDGLTGLDMRNGSLTWLAVNAGWGGGLLDVQLGLWTIVPEGGLSMQLFSSQDGG